MGHKAVVTVFTLYYVLFWLVLSVWIQFRWTQRLWRIVGLVFIRVPLPLGLAHPPIVSPERSSQRTVPAEAAELSTNNNTDST